MISNSTFTVQRHFQQSGDLSSKALQNQGNPNNISMKRILLKFFSDIIVSCVIL